MRNYDFDLQSIPLTEDRLHPVGCVIVVTYHKAVDYRLVANHARLIGDTRNVVPKDPGNVVEA